MIRDLRSHSQLSVKSPFFLDTSTTQVYASQSYSIIYNLLGSLIYIGGFNAQIQGFFHY